MLPFLKNKQEGGMSGPMDSIKRESDSDEESFEMLDAVVDDILEAVHKKDKALLKGALEAFMEHIQDQDEVQDHDEMES